MNLKLKEKYLTELSLSLESELDKLDYLLPIAIEAGIDENSAKLSLESNDEFRHLALEDGIFSSIWNFIKGIWKKILDYIKKAFSFIASFLGFDSDESNKSNNDNEDNDDDEIDFEDDESESSESKGSEIKGIENKDSNKVNINETIKITKDNLAVHKMTDKNVKDVISEKLSLDAKLFALVSLLAENIVSNLDRIMKVVDEITAVLNKNSNIREELKKLKDTTDDNKVNMNLTVIAADLPKDPDVEKLIEYKNNEVLYSVSNLFGNKFIYVKKEKEVNGDFEVGVQKFKDEAYCYTYPVKDFNKLIDSVNREFKLINQVIDSINKANKRIDDYSKKDPMTRLEKTINNLAAKQQRTGKFNKKELKSINNDASNIIKGLLNTTKKNATAAIKISRTAKADMNTFNSYFNACRSIYINKMGLKTKAGKVIL